MARLFKAIAYAEQVHATNHFKPLKSLGKTADNMDAAIGGETYEVEEMYPAFLAVTELQKIVRRPFQLLGAEGREGPRRDV